MTKEQINRLIGTGKEMRTFQKRYFRLRLPNDLSVCKHLEKKFDKLLQECSHSSDQQMQLKPNKE